MNRASKTASEVKSDLRFGIYGPKFICYHVCLGSLGLFWSFLPEAKPTGLEEAMSVVCLCVSFCYERRLGWPYLTRCDSLWLIVSHMTHYDSYDSLWLTMTHNDSHDSLWFITHYDSYGSLLLFYGSLLHFFSDTSNEGQKLGYMTI